MLMTCQLLRRVGYGLTGHLVRIIYRDIYLSLSGSDWGNIGIISRSSHL